MWHLCWLGGLKSFSFSFWFVPKYWTQTCSMLPFCCLMYHKCFFCCHPSELLLISTIATAITSSPHVAPNHLDSAHHGILCPPCVVLCFLLSNTSLFFCVPSVRQLCSLAKLLSSTICLITCLHPTVTLPARYVTGSDTPLASSGKKCETLINKSCIL